MPRDDPGPGSPVDASLGEPGVGPFGAAARSVTDPRTIVMRGEIDVAVVTVCLPQLPGWVDVDTVDLSEVSFVDSSAMRLLVQLGRLVAPRRLRVVGASGQPLSTLRMFRADEALDVVSSGAGTEGPDGVRVGA